VASVRTEPRTFNRLAARDSSTDLVSTLTQARLVRINKQTQEVEPWLAERWSASPDGRRVTLQLRQNITFSDGHPFTADDVVFSFAAVYDARAATVLADSLQVGGKPMQVEAADPHTVAITFPTPFAAGVRLLDNLPILPRHKLEAPLERGTFAQAWGLSTPASEIVGLGPFVLAEYLPGQRLVFARNPRYWRTAPDGTPLPYLDRLIVEIISDQNAELLRLGAGQVDITSGEIGPEAYATVKRAADAGRATIVDLGVAADADSLWFNLKPGAFAKDPRAAWLQRDELRRAISLSVDRKAFADTVFLGAGEPVYGPETPANKKWYWTGTPNTPHDPAAAKALLAAIGLTDRNGDGMLEDARGGAARFTLVTQRGRPRLERGVSVVREELKKVGIAVDVVALDGPAVFERIGSGQYDAVYFHPSRSDPDPAITPDFWFSSGTAHLWNMAQATPATEWEARIDALMTRQIASLDEAERKRLFDEVQRIFIEHAPVLYFAAPRVLVAMSSRVANATPAAGLNPILWSPDTVAVAR
jgi:peptide/nickel transport system substrate-binding protein